jgi:hypothetical protein
MTETRPTASTINDAQLDELHDALDGAYRERAHLVALLAAMTSGAVIAPALDVHEPGWQIAYLKLGGWQATWHIAHRDAELITRVEQVAADDPRAQWDGHTTDAKYTRIRQHTRVLQLRGQEPYGRCLCPPTQAGLELCARCPGHDAAPVSSGPAVVAGQPLTDEHAAAIRAANLPPGTRVTRAVVEEAMGKYGPADTDPDDPPVQCWHTEANTPCDWDVCKQPERLAAGDYGTDPREQH